MSIALHAATQARRLWLLPPRDFPQNMRVTLWITTAIHLDTPRYKTRPRFSRLPPLYRYLLLQRIEHFLEFHCLFRGHHVQSKAAMYSLPQKFVDMGIAETISDHNQPSI